MDRKVITTIVITVVFVAAVAVFEYMHFQVDTEVSKVPPEFLEQYDVTLPLDFVTDLESRAGNEVGPDLGY